MPWWVWLLCSLGTLYVLWWLFTFAVSYAIASFTIRAHRGMTRRMEMHSPQSVEQILNEAIRRANRHGTGRYR